ncbi:glutathione S-transferase protein-like protein [Dendryphion nanum]|uniref:Glutathione S-transferase protein-like protein n=1 Tax=Dendryphion nanum TaxID=256645 RepID=A0A9P9I8T9_9PLEO|nr:glutathione S-transferase protein-like protein [Dendryphion nanum]
MSHGTLYSFSESGNSYKVRLLAAVIGLDLQVEELDFLNDQQHSPEFLRINPRGEVPVLVDGEKTFRDSSSILVWLAGKYGDNVSLPGPSSFWSDNLYEQAQIIDWLAFANSWIQYGVFTNRAILSYNGPYNGLGSNDKWSKQRLDNILEESAIRGNKSLEILQAHLQYHQWLALGRPTIADISVFVYVALAPMGDISLQPYPAVVAWIDRIKKLPGFISIPGLDDPLVRRK